MAKKKLDPTSSNFNIKIKLYPNRTQEQTFLSWERSAKWLWNLCLEQRKDYWRKCRTFGQQYRSAVKGPSEYGQQLEVTLLKKECPFLYDTPSDILASVTTALQNSYNLFFSNLRKSPAAAGEPRFKGRRDSVTLKIKRINVNHLASDGNHGLRVKLPNVGWVKARGHLDLRSGKPKTVALKREFDGWYATISVEVTYTAISHPSKKILGVDVGISKHITTSSGRHYMHPDRIEKLTQRKKVLQRRMRRKKRGSANSIKVYKQIAKIDGKIARIRSSWTHEVSTDLFKRHGIVAVEDLNVRGMTKSAKGTAEKPGVNVKQKSGLNREILNVGFGMIRSRIEEKAKKFGGTCILVDPKFTSQQCSECGYVSSENRLSQSNFSCLKCGHKENADVNAAKNIRAKAIEELDSVKESDNRAETA